MKKFLWDFRYLYADRPRIGMEDTVWKYPHRDEKISSNVEAFKTVRDIALSLGRRPMPASTFRERMKAKRSTL